MVINDLIKELSKYDKNLNISIVLFNLDTEDAFSYEIDKEMIVDLSDEEENNISIVLDLDTEELQRSFPAILKFNKDNAN